MMNKLQISDRCSDNNGDVQAKCSKFRQDITRLICSPDAKLLSAIEHVYVECEGCKRSSDKVKRDCNQELGCWKSQCKSKDERIADLQNELKTLRSRVTGMGIIFISSSDNARI